MRTLKLFCFSNIAEGVIVMHNNKYIRYCYVFLPNVLLDFCRLVSYNLKYMVSSCILFFSDSHIMQIMWFSLYLHHKS